MTQHTEKHHRGDPHPTSCLKFWGYRNGREYWVTPLLFDRWRAKERERALKRVRQLRRYRDTSDTYKALNAAAARRYRARKKNEA